jgi:hypothetical protein
MTFQIVPISLVMPIQARVAQGLSVPCFVTSPALMMIVEPGD